MKSDAQQTAPTRRQHDRSFKAELVRQCMLPGASVSAIALRNGVNANMLFRWRRELRQAAAEPAPVALVPVQLVTDGGDAHTPGRAEHPATGPTRGATMAARTGCIELEVAGVQMRLRGAIDEDSLYSVICALRRSA